jgi:hypothetical protein
MRFETEDALRRFLNPFRRLNAKRAEIYGWNIDKIQAEFDEEISLNRALAELRAGLAKIRETREASGCEALRP